MITAERKKEIERELRIERQKDDPNPEKLMQLKYELDNRIAYNIVTNTFFKKSNLIPVSVSVKTGVQNCQSYEEFKKAWNNGLEQEVNNYIF